VPCKTFNERFDFYLHEPTLFLDQFCEGRKKNNCGGTYLTNRQLFSTNENILMADLALFY